MSDAAILPIGEARLSAGAVNGKKRRGSKIHAIKQELR
jgi:hypothetical protein